MIKLKSALIGLALTSLTSNLLASEPEQVLRSVELYSDPILRLVELYGNPANQITHNDLSLILNGIAQINVNYNNRSRTEATALRALSSILRAQFSNDGTNERLGTTRAYQTFFTEDSLMYEILKILLITNDATKRAHYATELLHIAQNPYLSVGTPDGFGVEPMDEPVVPVVDYSQEENDRAEQLMLNDFDDNTDNNPLVNLVEPTAPPYVAPEAPEGALPADDAVVPTAPPYVAPEAPEGALPAEDLTVAPEALDRSVSDTSDEEAIRDQFAIQQINAEILPRLRFSRDAKSVLGFAAAHGNKEVLDYLLKKGPVKASDVQEGLRLIQGRGANGRTASGKKANPEPWFDDIRARLQSAETY